MAPATLGSCLRRSTVCQKSFWYFKLALDPYPFDRDELVAPVTAQLIPDRAYQDPEDFLSTLAAADQVGIECVIVRP